MLQAAEELQAQNAALESQLDAVAQQLHAGMSGQQAEELEAALRQAQAAHGAAVEQARELERRLYAERAQVEALSAELAAARSREQAHADAVDEMELAAKAREAELNAEKLSLESQIHWLKEQNESLVAAAGAAPAPAPAGKSHPEVEMMPYRISTFHSCLNTLSSWSDYSLPFRTVPGTWTHQDFFCFTPPFVSSNVKLLNLGAYWYVPFATHTHTAVPVETAERITALETELRRAKRAEQKLQAMLYRLRKDLEDAAAKAGPGAVVGVEAFDKLRDVRNLEYEVDMLTQKAKVSAATCK